MAEKRIKVYLDTGVFIRLFDTPEDKRTAQTKELFEVFSSNENIIVCASNKVIDELNRTRYSKKQNPLYAFCSNVEEICTKDVKRDFVTKLMSAVGLTLDDYPDCIHMASALVNECDYLISWDTGEISNKESEYHLNLFWKKIKPNGKYLKLVTPTSFNRKFGK